MFDEIFKAGSLVNSGLTFCKCFFDIVRSPMEKRREYVSRDNFYTKKTYLVALVERLFSWPLSGFHHWP